MRSILSKLCHFSKKETFAVRFWWVIATNVSERGQPYWLASSQEGNPESDAVEILTDAVDCIAMEWMQDWFQLDYYRDHQIGIRMVIPER